MTRLGATRSLAALAVLTFAGAAADVSAQRLGRLFTTMEERANLDALRYESEVAVRGPEPEIRSEAPAEPEPREPAVSSLTVNGVVRRAGGTGSVWLNGDEIERGAMTRDGVEVQMAGRDGGSVRVRLPSGLDTIELKPGQKIDVLRGVVLEPYEKGLRADAPSAFDRPDAVAPAGAAPSPGPAPSNDAPAPAAATVDDALRRALDALPAPETLPPAARAEAEALRRRLEQAAAGAAPSRP